MATNKRRAAPAPALSFTGDPVPLNLNEYVNTSFVQPEAPVAPEPEGRTVLGTMKDVGISALKGVIAVPEFAVGLADLVTGGAAGQALEGVGFRPREAKAMLDEGYSAPQKEAFRRVQAAEGLGDTFMEALSNPSVIGHSVVESVPLMGAGGVVARGAMAVAPKIARVVAAAGGEGAVMAGSAAEQIRQQTADGRLTAGQAGLAATTGVVGAGFGLLGGKLAKKLGIADVDTLLAGAAKASPAAQKALTRRVLEGAVSEGVLEELPQSVSEQVLQNMALNKPLDEGLDQAAVLGLLSGSAMGGGANLLAGRAPTPQTEPPPPAPPPVAPPLAAVSPLDPTKPAGPLTRAANVAAATTLTGQTGADLLAIPDNPLLAGARVREEDRRQEDLSDKAMARLEQLAADDLQALNAARFEGQSKPVARATAAPAAMKNVAPEVDPGDIYPPEPGDILNPKGEPFKNKAAALTASKKFGGQVVQVMEGWAVRGPAATGGDEARAAAKPAAAGPTQVEGGGVAANKFDPKGLKPGTPEYNVAFDKWSSEQQGEKAAQEVARQRQENKAAVQKRNGWRAKLREWFLAAKDGDTISDVTGQTYKVIEKTRRDGTKIKSLAAVDEKGNSLGEGRATTGISQVGDRIDGLNDGGIDDDTGSALPETAGQSLASGLGKDLEDGNAKTKSTTTPIAPAAPKTGDTITIDGKPAAAGPAGVSQSELERIDAEERIAKPALRKRIAEGKEPLYEWNTQENIYIAKASDAVVEGDASAYKIKLTLTPDEKRAVKRADADMNLADTPEERAAARKSLTDAFRPAVDRALAEKSTATPAAPTPKTGDTRPVTFAPMATPIAPAAPKTGDTITVDAKPAEVVGQTDIFSAPSEEQVSTKTSEKTGNTTKTYGGYVDGDGVPVELSIVRRADGTLFRVFAKYGDGIRSEFGASYGPGITDEQIVKAVAEPSDWEKVAAKSTATPIAPAAPKTGDTITIDGKPAAKVEGGGVEPTDYLAELFGSQEQRDAAQAKYVAVQDNRKAAVQRIRDEIARQKERATAEYADWSGRKYKANKTQVDLQGDGPSNQASMSIGAINEGRRRNAMDALAKELTELDKLAAAAETESGAEKILANLTTLRAKAAEAVKSGNWPGSTEDSMFESMLLDALKFRGPAGKGNVTSNGLSKAMLAAINGAPPNPPTQARAGLSDEGAGESRPAPVAAPAKPADTQRITTDKAEMRPYRKPDGSVGYEAVPIVEAAPAGVVKVPKAVDDALTADMSKQQARMKRLRSAAEADGQSLEEKKAALLKATAAEATLRRMRTTRFDAEDAAVAAVAAGDLAPFAVHADIFPSAAQALGVFMGKNDELDAEMQAPAASDAVLDGWWGNGGISKDGRNLTAVGRTEALAAIGYNAPMTGAKLRWAYLPEQAREKLAAMHAQGWEPAAAPAPTAASAAPVSRNAVAARDLLAEYTKAVRDGEGQKALAAIKKRAQTLASNTPATDEAAVLALDMLATRMDTESFAFADAPAPQQAPAPAPAPKPDPLTEQEKAAKAKMLGAAAKLATLLSKNTRANITPEQEQQMLPIVIELFEGAMDLGYVKFKQAARYVREFIAQAIDQDAADSIPMDTLQGAYIATARRHADKDITPKKDVISVDTIADLDEPATNQPQNEVENAGPTADTAGKDIPNDRATDDATREGALDQVAPGENGAAPEDGTLFGGNAGGGQAGSGANGAAAGGRVPGARGGRGGAGRVRTPATGGRRRAGAVGARGTGPDGSQLSAFDEGLDPEQASAPNIGAQNYRITEADRLGQGGEVQKFNDNIAAIRVLKTLDAEQRRATPGEQRTLARYVGWGGLPSAFPNPKTGAFKDGWDARGKELRELLDDRSYDAAKRSTLDAHYTSETVVRAMWSAVARLGFKGGLALESSMGSGNFLGMIPQEFAGSTRFVGVEYDATTARVAEALYPQETVLHAGFHKVPVPDNTFALNIGNPPFGPQSLTFQFKPELAGVSIHNQFFRAAMDALRPGGVQALVVTHFLLDAQDKGTRLALAKQARLLGAIRLPDTAFKENARTEVVTDIIFLQKLTEAEQNEMAEAVTAYQARPEKNAADERERRKAADKVPAWVETGAVADPLGGEQITLNQYFKDNPRQILGVLERSGSMQHGADVTVRLDDKNALAGMLADAIARLPENVMNVPDEVLANTQARFKSLSDSLRIQLNKEEPGHLKIDLDGKLQRVLERETPEGDYEFMRQEINADSPWSEQLYLDAQGRWYRLDVALDEKGEKKKIVKNGKVTKLNEYERVVFQNEADIPATLRLGEDRLGRLTQLVRLRDYIKRQLTLEAEDKPESVLEASRKSLRSAYEAFVKAHGPVNRPANAALVGNMPDGGLVLASELNYKPAVSKEQAAKSGLDPREESVTPAPIMARRVVPKYEPPTKADSAADALIISLSERGRVDLERMASLVSKTEAEIIEELQAGDKPLIFKDPESGQWETSNAYLSGNVRKKLIAAKSADIPMNVKALEAVQPAPWTADQVTVMLGSAWVPPAIYAEFYEHITGGKAKASYSRATNTFSLGISEQGPQAGNWSSEGATAQYILSRLLNSQPVLVMTPGTREEGPKVDQEATAIAQLKAREMVDEFGDWVFRDAARRANLTEIFNDRYNTRVTRQHDGSHLTLPGKVPDGIISMRRHQKNAIWRGIAERFMLIDHAVGAGKTFTGIARAIERRRMGLSKKPMIVVPNHLVEQWAADVYRLYPGAKVLAASSKDFDVKRRRRLFAKIATGDWDIVIVPHSSFAFIGVAPETEERFLREELRIAMEAVEEAEQQAIEDGTAGGRGKPFGVKEAERLVEKIQGRLDKLGTKKDRLLTFEQMGVDDLTVDEAHEFKNLFYSARQTGVRGMGNKTGSQKAFDLYNKVRVLRESPTGSVTFMTGTPISNSAVEMFTMLRYLAADELRDMGMEHFDAWRAQFVEATSKFEPTESGRLKEVTRLGRSWSNMRSLMDLYYGVTDAVTNEDIQKWYREDKGVEFPIPKVKGGERQLVAMKPTEAQLGLLEQVMSAFDSLPGIQDPYERNKQRLRLMNVARSVSLDVRSIGRDKLQAAGISTEYGASPEKGGKLERVSEEIKRIYDKWTPDLGTQLVFLDRSVPKSKGDDKIIKAYDALQAKAADALDKGDEEAYSAVLEALEKYDANEIAELRAAQAGGWNAYQQLKDNLVAQGIPAAQIRFVQEADDDAKKKALFDAVNGGKVRVLIGSTPRMGAGTNVQQRLVGLHHVDVTWKPSDIEQREGRIIRQPSSDSFSLMEKYGPSHEVEIFAYATERTVDAKMWDLNATKLKMINGIRKYDGAFTMEFEDEDSVSMAEMAALASGDPMLLERVTLESQISTLELQERGFRRNQYSVEDQVRAAEKAIREGPSTIQTYKERAALTKPAVQALAEAANGRKVTIEGKTFNTQFSAAAAATEAIKIAKGDDENKRYSINVNGVGLTNKDDIADAIIDSLGDVEPFQMTVRGATYIRRTPAAKAITELVNEARKKQGDGETIKLGEVAGLELAADLKVGEEYDDVTLVLRKDGQTLAQGYGNPEVKRTQFTAGSIRGRIEKLLESLEQTARGTGDWAKERMEQAERDLPGLRERMGQKFPKAEEIEEKRRRLAEVIGTLSGAKPKAAPAPDLTAETEFGLGNIRQTGAFEGNTTDVAFMRGTPQTETKAFKDWFAGSKVVAVQQFMDSITEKWSNAPTVIVAANMEDPLVPKAVRDYNASQMAKDAAGAPMGFFYGGKVYVLADSLNSPQDALTVLAHEALGHYGLRGMFGDRLDGIKTQIIAMRKKEVLAKANVYRLPVTPEAVTEALVDKGIAKPTQEQIQKEIRNNLLYAAEEVLAEMAQTVPSLGFVKRAVAIVRQWLRENIPGFGKMELTDDEIINQYIVPARGWVVRGRDSGTVEPALAFMRDGKPVLWRSSLRDGLAEAKMQGGRADGWKAAIQGLINKGSVKEDEVEWSGIREWLDLQTGKVSKDAVLAYLDANGVKVEETVLGGDNQPPGYDADIELLSDNGLTLERNPEDPGMVAFMDENGDLLRADELAEEPGLAKELVLAAYRVQEAAEAGKVPTKYGNYTLPGGQNYREVLLTLPDKTLAGDSRSLDTIAREMYGRRMNDLSPTDQAGVRAKTKDDASANYKSSHWSQPNVLAHIRLNDRTDADGNRVLFVEEIQSDWGQEGKKKGFNTKVTPEQVAREVYGRDLAELDAAEREGVMIETEGRNEGTGGAAGTRSGVVPVAPFVTSTDKWLTLALKRVITMAAQEGYDRVAFVNGEQSAERYDLSKQVDKVEWFTRSGMTMVWAYPKNGERVGGTTQNGKFKNGQFNGKDIADVLGKEIAEKIANTPEDTTLTGDGLRVGGHGMISFYDKILPNTLKDVLKKVGGQGLETVEVGVGINTDDSEIRWTEYGDGTQRVEWDGGEREFETEDEARAFRDGLKTARSAQPGFTITPAMREKASAGLPMFSRGTAGNVLNTNTLRTQATERVSDFFAGMKAPGKLNWWHKTIGTQYNLAQRYPRFKRVFDAAQNFLNDVSLYATEAADLAPKILPKLETWRDIAKSPISAEDNKAIAAPIFEGTLKWTRVDGDLVETDDVATAGVVWSDAELESRYNLTPQQIRLYREFRAAVDKSLTNLAVSDMVRFAGRDAAPIRGIVMGSRTVTEAERTLVDYLQSVADSDAERAEVLESTIAAVQKKAERAGDLMRRGYAPLSRFGQYTLDVIDNGERVYFGLFESAAEAAKMARRMRANFPGAEIARGTVSQEEYKLFAGVSPETVELFGDLLGLEAQGDSEADKAFQTYIKVAKANRSSMKRLITRKGMAGFSEDAGRVLAGFVYSNARQTSQNLHMGELTEAAMAVNEGDARGDGELKDRAAKLVEYVKNPVEEAQAFRSLLFVQYLGGSVASALVNMTQPIQVTLPYLSQFGGPAKAAWQMRKALADVWKNTTGDARLDAALKRAEEEGLVAPQEVHQLMAQAQGKGSLQSGDGTMLGDASAKASNALSKLALGWGKFFGAAEQFNRRVTFIAAYRTAVDQGIARPADFAEKALAETQFLYNKGNKPQWARGAVGSTLFTFKQYSISYVELMNRMWQSGPEGKKAVLLAMGLLFLVGGAGGLPFVEDAEDLLDAMMQRLGYNYSTKLARRQFFERVVGKEAARFMERGISGLPGAPLDVSGRLGMGNLIPGTGLLVQKQDSTRDVTELAGPAGDFIGRLFKGANQALQGEVGQAAVTVSPAAARNAAKAVDMYATGIYKDERGRKVLDVDAYDAAIKFIGFQPNDVARVQQASQTAQKLISQVKVAEAAIADRWAKALAEGDADGVKAAREELRDWNRKNPETPIRIAPGQINKRVKAMRQDKSTRLEKTAPREIRNTVREELRPA